MADLGGKNITGPNILVTGTPGTGKTSLCEQLGTSFAADGQTFNVVDVGALVKEKDLHSGKDKVFDAFILDEDKVRIKGSLIMAIL